MSGANRLAPWVTSNEASVWRETEQSRRMTPEERFADVVAACDSLKLYWDIPGYPERIEAAVDPLPASSPVALGRLREASRREER